MRRELTHGNVESPHSFNNLSQLSPVAVTPSALVETEGPVLLHGRQSNRRLLVLLGHLRLRRSVVEE